MGDRGGRRLPVGSIVESGPRCTSPHARSKYWIPCTQTLSSPLLDASDLKALITPLLSSKWRDLTWTERAMGSATISLRGAREDLGHSVDVGTDRGKGGGPRIDSCVLAITREKGLHPPAHTSPEARPSRCLVETKSSSARPVGSASTTKSCRSGQAVSVLNGVPRVWRLKSSERRWKYEESRRGTM